MALQKLSYAYFKKWWSTIDNPAFFILIIINLIGAMLITAASPAIADRLKISSFYFASKQFVFLTLGLCLTVYISNLSVKNLRKFCIAGFSVCILFLIVVLFVGEEVKGAKRWLNLIGFSLQPSEMIKPFYIFLSGGILAEKFAKKNFPAFSVCIGLHVVMVLLLILQPDFGMVITFSTVLASQFFLAGLSLLWIPIVVAVVGLGAFLAYSLLPHVAKRIDSFLNPESNENYQVEKSLEAYINGGFFGKGPGEGVVKNQLPDSHTDFIFAVAGEEFGGIFASVVILIFMALVIRFILLLQKQESLFNIFVGGGIITLFSLQTIFNIGVTLHIFPTKGMTLPFISYGGSSTLSFAIAFGILFNLTKKQLGISFRRKTYPN